MSDHSSSIATDADDDIYDEEEDLPEPPQMNFSASAGGGGSSIAGNTTLSSNTNNTGSLRGGLNNSINAGSFRGGLNNSANNGSFRGEIERASPSSATNNNATGNFRGIPPTHPPPPQRMPSRKDISAKGFRLAAPQVDDDDVEEWGGQSEEQQPSQPFLLPDEPILSPNKVTRPSVTANAWGTLAPPGLEASMTEFTSTRNFLNNQQPEDFQIGRKVSNKNLLGRANSINSADMRAISNLPITGMDHSEAENSRWSASASGRNSLVQVRLEPSQRPEGAAQLNSPRRGASISRSQRGILYCLAITIFLLFVGVIAGVFVALRQDGEEDPGFAIPTLPPASTTFTPRTPSPTGRPTLTPTSAPPTISPSSRPTEHVIVDTLERLSLQQELYCGVVEATGFAVQDEGIWTGMDVDMCRAIAGAALGDAELVRIVPLQFTNRFVALNNGEIDVLAGMTTFTMERDVHEPTTQTGFTFSTPYLYDGLGFGGLPEFLDCAENRNVTGTLCEQLRICIIDGTTQTSIVQKHFAEVEIRDRLVPVGNVIGTYDALRDGFCNVIANDQISIAPYTLFENGYTGPYAVGTDFYSNEPISLVTRETDPRFSDFVNWVVQSLVHAEENNVVQETATAMGVNNIFGDAYAMAFADAVRAVGNYGEVYERNLEVILPRQDLNKINRGDSGLIYSYPFGEVLSVGPNAEGTLSDILDRGFLRCGITRRAIFAEFDTMSQRWHGIDIDMCRAVSAAIFDGIYSTVVFVDLPATERFHALQNGDVDLLSRITTLTLQRDVEEPDTGAGFEFTSPIFYDGLTFGGIPEYLQCAISRNINSDECEDLRICVNEGTTFLSILRQVLPERVLVPRISGSQTIEGLGTGECNVVAGGIVDVSTRSLAATGYTGPYELGTGPLLSKEPIALVTREGDPQWSSFVFWIVQALFYAEQEGITQDTSTRMPVVNLFGRLNFRMFRDIVASVGSFSQIYEREAESIIPRSGLNLLNTNPFGPQHYALPGVQ